MPLSLTDRVDTVEGVGRTRAATLRSAFGIETVRDLVEHYPRRYQDLGDVTALDDAAVGDPVTLIGTIESWRHFSPQKRRRLKISEATVRDDRGATFTVTFFNQPWRENKLGRGVRAAFSGKLERFRDKLKLTSPEVQALGGREADELDHQRLIPVYAATDKLPSWRIERMVASALEGLPRLAEHLPESMLDERDLLDLDTALRQVHAPESLEAAAAARRRLAFDELFTLQVGLHWRRHRLEAGVAGKVNSPVDGRLATRLLEALPFEPTDAQRRAFDELGVDLGAERPMHRLLQGDVGAGKTLVAAWSMLCAVDNGRQAALMVPTAVLAEQHERTLTELLAPLGVNVLDGVRVELLTSATTTSERRRILGELLSGTVDIVVGTHALLEEGVRFADLGLVVIDEQHRFGVAQRVKLKEKGEAEAAATGAEATLPDVLVMTATPIPRSLALTVYGDLDVTLLDELPPGRQPIVTQFIPPEDAHRRARLYDFVREQAADGHPTYVVCPLVEDSESLDIRSAEQVHAELRDDVFPDLRVELVHGRMRADEKEAAMHAIRSGAADVLVATTVIEVGVDVPDATIMIIENAERFGISQLHQLRGRVGRSDAKSYCVLFTDTPRDELTDDALQRLEAVAASTDGFLLAEKDLEIRGEGQLFGEKQSGLPDLKIARLIRDRDVIASTRQLAAQLIEGSPELDRPDLRALRAEVLRRFGGLDDLEALATG